MDSQNPLASENMHSVKGVVAVVTGGGSGIGLIMARALEANGAKVYILGRRLEKLQEAAKQAKHGNLHPIQCSVTSHEELQAAVDHITNVDGYINLLVNNAGISTPNLGPAVTRPTPKWALPRLRDYWFNRSFADYGAVMETNTIAHFIVSFAFLELLDQGNKIRAKEAAELEQLREAEAKLAANGLNGVNGTNGAAPKKQLKMRNYVSSQIVTTSSIGGFGRDNAAFIYNASKAATTHMMKQLATYLIPWGIRSNVICPGFWLTDMTEDMARGVRLAGSEVPKSLIPEQRFGTEHEMGGTITYLASPAGGYCNGLVMIIDGGYLSNHFGSY